MTFNLPNLAGRIPVHNGQGPGLQSYQIGESAGVESVTLTTQQIPTHMHTWLASTAPGTSNTPANNVVASPQCDGQLLPISQNTALFSLLGAFYGGDGKSTFGLPNPQDSVPIHQGEGQGLSEYALGQAGGTQTVTLLTSENGDSFLSCPVDLD